MCVKAVNADRRNGHIDITIILLNATLPMFYSYQIYCLVKKD